jgi:prepilin-type N-terminal cleavage/methylation domain-containing protein
MGQRTIRAKVGGMVCAGSIVMHMVWSKRQVVAFTLVELLVVIAVLAVVIAILLPSFDRPPQAHRIKCVNNLKNVGLAFRIFASDNQDRYPMEVSTNEVGSLELVQTETPFRHFAALSNELSTPKILVCPADKKRKAVTNFLSMRQVNLSYFVGLDATTGLTNAFLSGDRNLTTNGRPVKPGLVDLTTNIVVGWTAEIHNLEGNIALGDGSVQQFSSARLAPALRGTGLVTNRLAVP